MSLLMYSLGDVQGIVMGEGEAGCYLQFMQDFNSGSLPQFQKL